MLFLEKYTWHRAWTDPIHEKFFWEPASGCWRVRRRGESHTRTPFGNDDWVADFDAELGERADRGEATEPMTTVAWLMWHMASVPGRWASWTSRAARSPRRAVGRRPTLPIIPSSPRPTRRRRRCAPVGGPWTEHCRHRRTSAWNDRPASAGIRAPRSSSSGRPDRRVVAQRDRPPMAPRGASSAACISRTAEALRRNALR